jgi:hypothetical protein
MKETYDKAVDYIAGESVLGGRGAVGVPGRSGDPPRTVAAQRRRVAQHSNRRA